MIELGSTNISKISNQSGMDEFVQSLGLTSKRVIIKPNWVDGLAGSHTESKIAASILDINKIYQSLFKYHFVIDGIYTVGDMNFDTSTCLNHQNWGGNSRRF